MLPSLMVKFLRQDCQVYWQDSNQHKDPRLVERLADLAGLKISKIFHSPGINVDDCTDASEYLGLEMSKI